MSFIIFRRSDGISEDFSKLAVEESACPIKELHLLHIPSDSSEEDFKVLAHINQLQLHVGIQIIAAWRGGSVYVLCLVNEPIEGPIAQLSYEEMLWANEKRFALRKSNSRASHVV